MNFTATELRTLITSIFPNIKANKVSSRMKHRYIIKIKGKEKELYILNEDLIYIYSGNDIKNQILVETTKILQQAFMNLTKEETNHHKTYRDIFKNCNVETYLPQL